MNGTSPPSGPDRRQPERRVRDILSSIRGILDRQYEWLTDVAGRWDYERAHTGYDELVRGRQTFAEQAGELVEILNGVAALVAPEVRARCVDDLRPIEELIRRFYAWKHPRPDPWPGKVISPTGEVTGLQVMRGAGHEEKVHELAAIRHTLFLRLDEFGQRWLPHVCPDERPEKPLGAVADHASSAPPAAGDSPTLTLLRVFTNGVADERIKRAAQVLSDANLTVNDKLTGIAALIPFPPTASAEQLAAMLDVSKTAVIRSDWWTQNRRGEKDNEIGRRRIKHNERAEGYGRPD